MRVPCVVSAGCAEEGSIGADSKAAVRSTMFAEDAYVVVEAADATAAGATAGALRGPPVTGFGVPVRT